ncbi:MAG: septation protein A [Usitatibacteraceae bacterium]
MKLILDFLPVILFFGAYKFADIYVATGVAIAATIAQIGWTLWRREKVKPVQWIALIFILVFGGATILLHDEYYIKLKWTLFYGLMGLTILGAVAMRKNPIKSVLGQEIELPDHVWRKLSMAWGFFFLLLACLNQYFASTLSLDAWVKVKVFGGSALSFVFVIAQAFWMAKYLPDEAVQAPTKP